MSVVTDNMSMITLKLKLPRVLPFPSVGDQCNIQPSFSGVKEGSGRRGNEENNCSI